MPRALAAGVLAAGIATGNVAAQDGSRTASAATLRLASVRLADLEQAFWVCDYVATTHGYAELDVRRCTLASDALRERKFGGDFERLLAWWRVNKPVEHGRLRELDPVRR